MDPIATTSRMPPDAADAPLEYVTEARVAAPPDAVWAALTDVESWPRWWPFVRNVESLRPGDASGVGAVRRLHWSTRLPYRFALVVECVEARAPLRLTARSVGDLNGVGRWELSAVPGGTLVRYTWHVTLGKPWMRRLAPLLEPLFRWNHDAVMRAGYAGLERQARRARAQRPAP
jgi:uncharacterized protein YndB with AHSA1/START domain